MIKKYVKNPVVVEAIQWTGKNLKTVISFTGLHSSASKWTWEEYKQVVKDEGLIIFTLEGKMKANIGDFIIKGIKGEFYPCKSEIFEATYTALGGQEVQGEKPYTNTVNFRGVQISGQEINYGKMSFM